MKKKDINIDIDELEEKTDSEKKFEKLLDFIYHKSLKPIDFTYNYHVGDEILDTAFNNRFNKTIELQELFDKKHDLTKSFFSAIKHRISSDDHVILVFFKRTKSGKSWAAISTAYYIQKMFKEVLDNDSKIFVSFSNSEYSDYLPEMNEKDIMIRDETPKMSGTGTRTLQKNLDNISSITRAGQYCFLFVSPKIVKADVVTYYLEAAGINLEEEKSRFIVYDEDMEPLGRIFVNKPTDEKFLEEYEKRKKENIKKKMKDKGLDVLETDMEKMESDVKHLAQFCIERGARRKGEIKSSIGYFNKAHPKTPIYGIGDTIQDLINNVFLEIKNKKNKEYITEPMEDEIINKKVKQKKIKTFFKEFLNSILANYNFDVNSNLKEIYKKRTDRVHIIIEEILKGDKTQKEILAIANKGKKKKTGNQSSISDYLRILRGFLHNQIGKLFEEDLSNYFNQEYIEPRYTVNHDGSSGRPDIYIIDNHKEELIVISCKCLEIKERKKIKWKDEFFAEFDFARKNVEYYKKVNVFLAICFAESGIVNIIFWDWRYPKDIIIKNIY